MSARPRTAPEAAAPAPLPEGLDFALLDAVPGPLGLAVSGGGDSTALAVLLAEARPERPLVLLTVDHRLREGSADDVRFVAGLGDRLGLEVVALAARSRPAGSVQTWAREERFALLAEAAEARGLAALVTAHTLDDQAETLLLRLARGSGLRGLGAMRADTVRDGVRVLRPLLGASRAALREALTARGFSWREDPSNADSRFDRVAMRQMMPRLAAVGLSADRLAGAAAHLARASAVVDGAVEALLAEAMRVDRAGAVTLARGPFEAAPDEVRLRALGAAVQVAGGGDYPPPFAPLAALDARLRAGGRATLGRACIAAGADKLTLWRELRAIRPLRLGPGGRGVFDGRWRVRAAGDVPELVIAPLGEAAAAQLGGGPGLAAAPGLMVDGVLCAAPTLGVRRRGLPAGWVRLSRVR